jgi:cobalamin biosynthesis protein CobT
MALRECLLTSISFPPCSGAIKHSALERALAQVGARATGTLTQKQFGALLDIIQEKLEVANLDTAALEEGLARASAREESSRSKVKSSDKNRLSNDKLAPAPAEDAELELDDFDLTDAGEDSEEDEDAEYEDSEGAELSEEEAAREIYDELRGSKASATVGDFLQWEDVVELLEVGALSRDDLAKAMSSAEVDVQSGNASDLPFPVVSRC